MTGKTRTLLALGILHLLAGFAIGLSPQSGKAIFLALSLASTVATYIWCRQDRRERSYPHGSALWAAVLPPVGLPVYHFRTRGLRGGFIAIVKALLYYLLLGVAMVLCGGLASR